VLKKIKKLGAVVALKVSTKDAPTFAMSIFEYLPKAITKF
jgi:hypothetical protein